MKNDQKSIFEDNFINNFSRDGFIKYSRPLDPIGISSVKLNMYFRETLLAKGTGWFWRLRNGVALVTAWHNFSGLHHTSRTTLSPHGGMPDRVYFRHMTKNSQTLQEQNIPLYLDADRTKPRWFVHPICGNYFDFCCILLTALNLDLPCLNDFCDIDSDLSRPGDDVFAVGFPSGISILNVFSVWKRGSIASDPGLPVGGHPKFFIDIAGRGGLSGAPVLRIRDGLIPEITNGEKTYKIGRKTEFIGLYSGRSADQLPLEHRSNESTDLGFVWRANVIAEMLSSMTLDEQPEVGKGRVEAGEFWGEPPANVQSTT